MIKSSETVLSPYLRDSRRLVDVIAAIQAMGTYKYYKLSFDGWADRMSADKSQAEKWKKLFIEHPEFFRLDSAQEKASLVWRRQFPKRYFVDSAKLLTDAEYEALSAEQKQSRVSRRPLDPADIKALIDTAVNLHSRALEHQKDGRWWLALSGAAGGLIGAIAGALIKG